MFSLIEIKDTEEHSRAWIKHKFMGVSGMSGNGKFDILEGLVALGSGIVDVVTLGQAGLSRRLREQECEETTERVRAETTVETTALLKVTSGAPMTLKDAVHAYHAADRIQDDDEREAVSKVITRRFLPLRDKALEEASDDNKREAVIEVIPKRLLPLRDKVLRGADDEPRAAGLVRHPRK